MSGLFCCADADGTTSLLSHALALRIGGGRGCWRRTLRLGVVAHQPYVDPAVFSAARAVVFLSTGASLPRPIMNILCAGTLYLEARYCVTAAARRLLSS